MSSTKHSFLGLIVFMVILGAGLLLGTQSTLVLVRDATGRVDATNVWRLHDSLPLISRTVTGLREARIANVRLTIAEQRSSIHRDIFGMLTNPEELILVGDASMAYPYQEDQFLIQAFLHNSHSQRSVIAHPVDIRRSVSSWILLLIAATAVIGWIVQLVLRRDPLAHAPDKVRPLPPVLGGAVFIGVILLGIAFFTWGDQFFGPLATRKVNQLMASARIDDVDGVGRAISSGVFVDVRDSQGITALMEAARRGAFHAAQVLLRANASPDLRGLSNESALDLAIQGGYQELALLLIDAKADIHAGGMNGRTPLYLAASSGGCRVLERLIALGASIAQKDEQGWTPLMAAAASGKVACVRDLLAAGADPSIALKDGRRAVDMAIAMSATRPANQAQDMEIQRLLLP